MAAPWHHRGEAGVVDESWEKIKLLHVQEGAAVASLSEPPGDSDGEVDSSRSDRQQNNR